MNLSAVIRKVWVGFGLAIAVVCLTVSAKGEQSEGKKVSYERIKIDEYQNFLKNWDSVKHPVLFALVGNSKQYDTLFSPAAVGGNRKPFAPEEKIYNDEQILIVAKEMIAPPSMEASFKVEKLTEENGNLVLNYVYNRVKSNATYSVKNYLGLRIPKGTYKKLTVIQNGQKVGELQLDQGEWISPEIEKE